MFGRSPLVLASGMTSASLYVSRVLVGFFVDSSSNTTPRSTRRSASTDTSTSRPPCNECARPSTKSSRKWSAPCRAKCTSSLPLSLSLSLSLSRSVPPLSLRTRDHALFWHQIGGGLLCHTLLCCGRVVLSGHGGRRGRMSSVAGAVAPGASYDLCKR